MTEGDMHADEFHRPRTETLIAALLHLMTHYSRTGCPRLAVCILRHLQYLGCIPTRIRSWPRYSQACPARGRKRPLTVGPPISGTEANLRTWTLADLRLHVVLDADPGDEVELHLEPVDVLFLAFEDLLEQLARNVVGRLLAVRDR